MFVTCYLICWPTLLTVDDCLKLQQPEYLTNIFTHVNGSQTDFWLIQIQVDGLKHDRSLLAAVWIN